jgi:hypothetical protein
MYDLDSSWSIIRNLPIRLGKGMKIEIQVCLMGKAANAEVVYVDPEQPLHCGIALAKRRTSGGCCFRQMIGRDRIRPDCLTPLGLDAFVIASPYPPLDSYFASSSCNVCHSERTIEHGVLSHHRSHLGTSLRSIAMFASKVAARLNPNSLTRFMLLMESEILPWLRSQSGFLNLLILSSADGRAITAISFWEREVDAQKYHSRGHPETLKILAGLLDGRPYVQAFDVIGCTFHGALASPEEDGLTRSSVTSVREDRSVRGLADFAHVPSKTVGITSRLRDDASRSSTRPGRAVRKWGRRCPFYPSHIFLPLGHRFRYAFNPFPSASKLRKYPSLRPPSRTPGWPFAVNFGSCYSGRSDPLS